MPKEIVLEEMSTVIKTLADERKENRVTRVSNKNESFPGPRSFWPKEHEARLTIAFAPFEAIKKFIKIIQDIRTVYLIHVICENEGLKYIFTNFQIGYMPCNDRWGRIQFVGHFAQVTWAHQECLKHLCLFKVSKHIPKFNQLNETIEYRTLKLLYQVKWKLPFSNN